MIISLFCKKEESEKERQEEVGRETESKRDLKQRKRINTQLCIYIMDINLSSTAHLAFSAFHLNRLTAIASDLSLKYE